ncbi:MAG: tRNA (adenosine(37)-N6)-threonylcarbamoyltransferase complex ATPase subunit type 1 TsaE [Alphaproteobacteria bacterium]
MSHIVEQYTLTYEEMHEFVVQLAPTIHAPLTILLEGDLGAGKTTFARFLIQALVGELCEVPSPTFTLMQTYESPQGMIHHYDLYRLHSLEEAVELGIEESLAEAITLIEWPAIVNAIIPENHIQIRLRIISESQRFLELNLFGETVVCANLLSPNK